MATKLKERCDKCKGIIIRHEGLVICKCPPFIPPPQPKSENIFDLSFRGGLPDILRALAAQIEAGEVISEMFEWKLTDDRCTFAATLEFPSSGRQR